MPARRLSTRLHQSWDLLITLPLIQGGVVFRCIVLRQIIRLIDSKNPAALRELKKEEEYAAEQSSRAFENALKEVKISKDGFGRQGTMVGGMMVKKIKRKYAKNGLRVMVKRRGLDDEYSE